MEQDDMTVEQYDAEFDMLSHFASELIRPRLQEEGQPQELAAARRTLRQLPICRSCGRSHGGRCLAGSGVCFSRRCHPPPIVVVERPSEATVLSSRLRSQPCDRRESVASNRADSPQAASRSRRSLPLPLATVTSLPPLPAATVRRN
ncbi:ty3-gypsy retrotransposon protein [Cucumis melo var. makuwa]|uniref:Ty3-gypsy retrotransposon protein n=1 Tax=Cucumis melo var. makuwa TaxID=1194695 RepID=A0A5D3DVN6_CUCMM|nr:ty3-gypsy retrotransposon protein [Cucumis melo var. makuwa]TYK27479.1 ty3-gypsy retrotransposon protein [Cucumis melo var. makuwa]